MALTQNLNQNFSEKYCFLKNIFHVYAVHNSEFLLREKAKGSKWSGGTQTSTESSGDPKMQIIFHTIFRLAIPGSRDFVKGSWSIVTDGCFLDNASCFLISFPCLKYTRNPQVIRNWLTGRSPNAPVNKESSLKPMCF